LCKLLVTSTAARFVQVANRDPTNSTLQILTGCVETLHFDQAIVPPTYMKKAETRFSVIATSEKLGFFFLEMGYPGLCIQRMHTAFLFQKNKRKSLTRLHIDQPEATYFAINRNTNKK
jgi:hypothetical protein